MAATSGIITAIGSDGEVRRLAGPKTETVDLKGAVMFPGFMEAHSHLPMFGYLNGTIESGKRADFTIMAADPRDVEPDDVPDIPFVMTVVGGEIVWSS